MNIKEYLDVNKIEDAYSFGAFVRQRRKELGYTVRGFAKELEVTPAYLSDIEKGNRYAPKAYMEKIRELLQICSEDMLLFEDLGAATRGFQYEDINQYLGKQPLARAAVRKARDLNISSEMWQKFIDSMDQNKGTRKTGG